MVLRVRRFASLGFALVVVVGCGRTALLDREASDGADPWTPAATWGAPAPIVEINSAWEDAHPTMSSDVRTICFSSERSGGMGQADLWCATRPTPDAAFDPPFNLTFVNSPAIDWMPHLSRDGQRLYFASNRSLGAGSFDIWVATMDPALGTFTSPINVEGVNSAGLEGGPSVTADGLAMFHDRVAANGSNTDLAFTTRGATGGGFAPFTLLSTVNTDHFDQEPAISPDERSLAFCSNDPRWGILWPESFALLISHRSAGTWSAPEPIPIDQPAGRGGCGLEFVADGSLLFHSSRPGGQGGADIYLASLSGSPAEGDPP